MLSKEIAELPEGEYRVHFTSRSAWNATLRHERNAKGAVTGSTLEFVGETEKQNRSFALAENDGNVIVPTKPNWGSLEKINPRVRRGQQEGEQATPATAAAAAA